MTTLSKNSGRLEYKAAFPAADGLGAFVRRIEARTLRLKCRGFSRKGQLNCEELRRRHDEAQAHVDYVVSELERVNREIAAIQGDADRRANIGGSFEAQWWGELAGIAVGALTGGAIGAATAAVDAVLYVSDVSAEIRRTANALQAALFERDELNAYYKVALQRQAEAGRAYERAGCHG